MTEVVCGPFPLLPLLPSYGGVLERNSLMRSILAAAAASLWRDGRRSSNRSSILFSSFFFLASVVKKGQTRKAKHRESFFFASLSVAKNISRPRFAKTHLSDVGPARKFSALWRIPPRLPPPTRINQTFAKMFLLFSCQPLLFLASPFALKKGSRRSLVIPRILQVCQLPISHYLREGGGDDKKAIKHKF